MYTMPPAPEGWHSFKPLLHINNPQDVWARQPTLLIAEVVFLALFAGATYHAFWWNVPTRAQRRRRIALWAAAIIGGASIELCTVMKRDIGNFYHSQATIMLFGLREPLYMLVGCYGFFNYVGCALVWEWSYDSQTYDANAMVLGPWTQALSAGLIGSLGWDLLDTVGLKLLWWTWHNDEPLYNDRRYGVPIASSFWIFSSIASLSLVFHWWRGSFLDSSLSTKMSSKQDETSKKISNHNLQLDLCGIVRSIGLGVLLGPFATIVVMNGPFLILYHPLVTAAGFHAAFPYAIIRGLSWTALIGWCFQDSGGAGNNLDPRNRLLWLQNHVESFNNINKEETDEASSDDAGTEINSKDDAHIADDNTDDMNKSVKDSHQNEQAKWLSLILIFATCVFSVSLVYGSEPEKTIRLSFGQPVTFDRSKCKNTLESSFWGGFQRKKYICFEQLDEDRDAYTACRETLPAFHLWQKKRQDAMKAKDSSIVDNAWFPLCGTKMTSGFRHAVLFEVAQLSIASLLVCFCGQSTSFKSNLQSVMISDLGAMSIMLLISLAMINPPFDEKTPRAPIKPNAWVSFMIHGGKWSIFIGIAAWILWEGTRRFRERFSKLNH